MSNPKVLILCGGKGERLLPLTESLPKPLVPIKGKPILSYIMSHLKKYGIEHFVVATGYKAERVDAFLKESPFSYNTTTVNSGDVDIIQRIKDAKQYIEDDVILLYGDTLSDVNISELVKFHQSHNGKATVTVWRMRSQFGILEFGKNGMISSFKEKPVLDKWINIGYFYFDKEILEQLSPYNKFEDFLMSLIESGELFGYRHEGAHITINTHKELQDAEDKIDQVI